MTVFLGPRDLKYAPLGLSIEVLAGPQFDSSYYSHASDWNNTDKMLAVLSQETNIVSLSLKIISHVLGITDSCQVCVVKFLARASKCASFLAIRTGVVTRKIAFTGVCHLRGQVTMISPVTCTITFSL